MPYFNYRPLLLASAALLGSAIPARAQFVDLLTEAPVTIQASIQSTVKTNSGGANPTISTAVSTVRLTNLQVIQELIDAEIIDDTTPTGWSLVAVRSVPPDLFVVDAGFSLYAIKAATQPVPIPETKFKAIAYRSVAKYTEKHQGRYIYSSSGTTTNHAEVNYAPKFVNGAFTYSVNDSESAGFASVKFAAKDFADDYEVFFYGISSVSVTTKGGFSGTIQQGAGTPESNTGLISLTVNVGAAKLVPATKYPEVDPNIFSQ